MTKQMKFGLVMLATAVLSVASLVNARGWVQNGADWYYTDSSNEIITETIQASGNSKFYLGEDGAMQRDFFLEDYNGATYYFGSNGAMVLNTWVAIDSSIVENQTDYIPDAYWYYFGSNGKAVKGKSSNLKATTIDGRKYIFNENGQMCTGWVRADSGTVNVDEDSNPFTEATYYCGGDNDGVVRTGWVSYYDGYDTDDDDFRGDLTTLYFYFNPSNGKKTAAADENDVKTKNINGRTYAFNFEGIMMSGWDAWESQSTKWTDGKPRYFSGEDDGHQVKKGWVYAVPGEKVDSKAHDEDEEKYMYFANNGTMYINAIKKINGKYYVFDKKGIMKTGLVIWQIDGTSDEQGYVDKIDLDVAEGADIMKKGKLQTDDDDYIIVDSEGTLASTLASTNKKHVKLHYFGSDGARRIGANIIEFTDNNYTFVSKNSGNYNSGINKKKYYSLGMLCQADADLKYGLYVEDNRTTGAGAGPLHSQTANDAFLSYCNGALTSTAVAGYTVLSTSGAKVKGSKAAKKDADGNYWLISNDNGFLIGIYSVNIKYADTQIKLKSKFEMADANWERAANGAYLKGDNSKSTTWGGQFSSCADLLNAATYIGGTNPISTFQADEVDPAGGLANFDNNLFKITRYQISSVSNNSILNNGHSLNYVTITGSGYWYQSDYNGASNKWIPAGIADQAGNTAHVVDYKPWASGSMTSQSYSVVPDDTYFLNCYWKDK